MDVFDHIRWFFDPTSARQSKMLCGVVLWLSCACLTTAAQAQALRIVSEELPPLQFIEDGSWRGINAEQVKRAIKHAGLDHISIESMPWPRALRTARTRKNTLLFSIVRTPNREDDFIWIALLHRARFGFVGRKSSSASLASVEDAKQYITAVIKDDLAHQFLLTKQFSEHKHLVVLSTVKATFEFISRGRSDFIITSNAFLHQMAGEVGFDPDDYHMALEVPELSLGFYLVANPQTDKHLIAQIKAGFQSLEK